MERETSKLIESAYDKLKVSEAHAALELLEQALRIDYLSLLKQYHDFLAQFDKVYDGWQYAMRGYIFSTALSFFSDLLGDGVNRHDPGLLLLVGRCYKGLGNYDEALKYFEQAIRFNRENAATLAELADINALLAETRAAKALFREAFFLDPGKVEYLFLESEMILRLWNKVAAIGFKEDEVCEWIGVYGCLEGVFQCKKGVETGRGRQAEAVDSQP